MSWKESFSYDVLSLGAYYCNPVYMCVKLYLNGVALLSSKWKEINLLSKL